MKFISHLKGRTWESAINKKWWPNQKQAMKLVGKYLATETNQQAMIRMPTGTGKSVVIAGLAQLLEDYPRVLVVAPWENLVSQLQREISSRVWKKIDEEKSLVPKATEAFTPSSLKSKLKKVQHSGILVCTIQTLQSLHKNNSAFQRLKKWATLALVDEGHREPAPRWAKAVRDLECPTVLLTATPYRNDLQLFDVSRDFFYSFTFDEAVEKRIVRDVEFVDGTWPRSGPNAIEQFVTQLLVISESTERKLGLQSGQMRAIIRCADASDVKAVTEMLHRKGASVIGVHERFRSADGAIFRRKVPDPTVEAATFWVHQNKLIEGLDDPAFRLVVIFGPFANARNLVQQIGRIIRNPARAARQKAFVLRHLQDRQKDLWERFLTYEKDVRKRTTGGHAELSAFDDFVASQEQAPTFYLLGDFRKHLRSDEVIDPRPVIQMRKSVLVRTIKTGFSWERLVFSIQSELLRGDTIAFGKAFQDKNIYLQLFQVFDQSDIVSEAYLEIRLGYVFVKQTTGLLCFYDTEGRSPEYLKMRTLPISPNVLRRLLPDTKTTIKEVSLINGDFGNHAFRRRIVSTDSLQVVPPALSDYVQVCSTATGSVRQEISGINEMRRRYVGFGKGRLSERTTPIIGYGEFEDWLTNIAKELNDSAEQGDDVLKRFAKPHKYDGNEAPRHILFDIASEPVDTSNLGTTPGVDIEKLWIVDQNKFCGELDEKAFEATITYNPETMRFDIESDQLDRVYIELPDKTRKSFTKYLNETQNFRVLLDTSTIYTQGHFFTLNQLPWRGGGSRFNIQNIVVGCAGLEGVESEKGDKSGWRVGSVFGAIRDKTKVFKSVGWVPEILVCNDMGNPEIADFFALSQSTKRIVMIHGKKARQESSMSASAFHEVCSQAVRYLGFFNPADLQTKLTTKSISNNWCPDQTKHPKLKRIVWAKENPKASMIVGKFSEAIADPTYSREVWLVMGNGLSKKAFEQAMGKPTPKSNEREISFLFQSTWSAVASVGASLKVICMR